MLVIKIHELLENPLLSEEKKVSIREKLKLMPEPTKHENFLENNVRSINFSPNSAYPSMSSAITIEYEKDRGRFGIANRDIKVGETMVYESPTGAKVKKGFEKDHCDNCLR